MMRNRYKLASAAACVVLALCVTSRTSKAGQAGRNPVKVFILAGQSNMEGQGVVDLDDQQYYNGGKGNLEHVMQDPAKAHLYKHLKGDDGNWVVRDDVWVWYKTENEGVKKGGLTLGYTPYPGKHHFGPELQFGHVIGDLLDNQVLLIKTAWGGKSLYHDFRPPSSGGEVGPCYTKMLEEIHESLANTKKDFPDYDGLGYQIAGFVWFQGWNDMINNAAVVEYEQNLANLIKDVRKELRMPNLLVVIGETGNCDNIPFRKAQAAVAQRPELKGTVAFVETVQFRRPANESPNVGHGHHWYGNAESYFLIGNALGEAMKNLLKAACTDEKPDPPKPQARTVRNIEGWIVRVDERLLAPPNEELGLRALKLLEAKLADIKYVMAEEPLVGLQSVPIVLDLTHGKLRVMQYHPDADWLEANGYSTDLVKCVHIPEAADLLSPRNIKEQPWVVLHELAHAYHDQVLGFDEPRIREAYERFKRSGHGDSVLAYDGKRVRHYALTDHKEFFAEMTEAHFGTNDFFPFNRAELMTAEPEIFELLRTIWEPVQPAGAAEKAQLDKLLGQPVDIAPWAYAWRADRTIQEKPEAYFIPRRLERIDKVYRTALDQLGSDGLKSKYYDMPDLVTPLPPKPKGQLLAGLLWPVRLANYRVELIWPAAREVPSPEAVEVRAYPTAFGWFGWCSDEILGQPEISADRRTWTYNHSVTTEIPAVVGRTHRRGSATEMVAVFCEEAKTPNGGKSPVPTVRLISPTTGTWKRMDVEIEWGFQSGSEEADFDGRLESDLSVIGPVSPLADDKGTTVTGPHAWQSRAADDGRRGIVLPLLYVPGDRPALDTSAVTASLLVDTTSPGPSGPGPGPTLDSRVTLWTKSGGVTFRPIDLEKGPILIPEHGLFIARAGTGKTARQFTAELAARNLKSVRQLTREHREAASWDELMREVRWWRCPEKPAVPPFPEVEEPAMQVQLSDVRWTDAWRAASHQLRGRHMWGGLAFEVGRVARQMDMVGLHDEANKVYQHFLKGAGAKPDGDYADGRGALEWATGMKHDMGYDHDGTHASTGRLLFGMAERYFLTGDKEWFRRHRDRLQAAADWIIRQRNTYMRDVPNREDLLVAGLMPPYMLGDYALPASDWRWYYCDDAFSLQGLQRFADALAEFDAEAGQNYRAEADAFRRDIRRAVDREAALSPVRLGRDGVYRSFIPIAAHTKGLMLALEFPSVGRPQGDVILGGPCRWRSRLPRWRPTTPAW